MEQKMTNEVPIQGVLKWIRNERDRLQEKLDKIVPYTKSLEQKVKDLQAELAKLKDDKMEERDGKIRGLEAERQHLLDELAAFRNDYRQTQWFIQIDGQNTQLRKENKALKKAVSQLINGYKHQEEEDGEEQ